MSKKSIPQKLFLRENFRFLLVNPPRGYLELMGTLPEGVTLLNEFQAPVDLLQVFVKNRKELDELLDKIIPLLSPKVILWITYLKGTSKIETDINRDIIAQYAAILGLQAVAIVAIDQDWAALRLKVKA